MDAVDRLAGRRDLAAGWADLEEELVRSGLSADLRDWSRSRVRQLLGATDVATAPAPSDDVADFVELFFMDVHSVTDEQSRAVVAEIGDEGLVALVVWLGLSESRARMELMLG